MFRSSGISLGMVSTVSERCRKGKLPSSAKRPWYTKRKFGSTEKRLDRIRITI